MQPDFMFFADNIMHRVQERGTRPETKITAEREKTENGSSFDDQRLSDLCQAWFLAGQKLGIYLTKQQTS